MEEAPNSPTVRVSPRSIEKQVEQEKVKKMKDIRRSVRDPSQTLLEKSDYKNMIEKIKDNHPETVVLKIKHHMLADVNSAVLDGVFEALAKNNVCEALYAQNLTRAFGNEQIHKLVELLKKKKIWCLNLGENYDISNATWEYFCKSLPQTFVTHLYVSEHVISLDLKNRMRAHIRENRKKHDKHCSIKNIRVIERCTNMWWNPINGIKELKPPPPPSAAPQKVYVPMTQNHTVYWQEGKGPGGDVRWRFSCTCGETCTSYENFRYHPTGKMYECTKCSVWSHVHCVLGNHVSDDDLEEMELMCSPCRTKTRRQLKADNPELYAIMERALQRSYSESGASHYAVGGGPRSAFNDKLKLKEGAYSKSTTKRTQPTGPRTPREPLKVEWRFKCQCGELCSSYENPLYHPAGKWYECTMCSVWSHVVCMYGDKMTDEKMEQITDALCYSCRSKSRRIRGRGALEETPVQATPVAPAHGELTDSDSATAAVEEGETKGELCVDQSNVKVEAKEEAK